MIEFVLDLAFGRLAVRSIDSVVCRWKLRALRHGKPIKIYGRARFPDAAGFDEEVITTVSPGLIVLEARSGRPRRVSLPLRLSDLAGLEAAEGWARYAINGPANGSAIVFACKVEYGPHMTRAAEAQTAA